MHASGDHMAAIRSHLYCRPRPACSSLATARCATRHVLTAPRSISGGLDVCLQTLDPRRLLEVMSKRPSTVVSVSTTRGVFDYFILGHAGFCNLLCPALHRSEAMTCHAAFAPGPYQCTAVVAPRYSMALGGWPCTMRRPANSRTGSALSRPWFQQMEHPSPIQRLSAPWRAAHTAQQRGRRPQQSHVTRSSKDAC